ncbi:hypothetical protein BC941DRAFT_410509 [Chlamydoabsidia padenii]|nr:hypothetical protein BC941DRAFT_410509 [Chlamydoabsidia padenii]
MDSTQETSQEWQVKQSSPPSPHPAIQSPPLSEGRLANNETNDNSSIHSSSQVNNSSTYSATPTLTQQQQPYPYPSNTMMHPPMHPYPQQEQSVTASGFMTTKEDDSEPRLPGLTILSQPSTPRPNSMMSDGGGPVTGKRTRHHPYYSSFASIPYPMVSHKRSRTDGSHLYSAEIGPSFSAAKPLDNLYSSDRSSLLTVRVQSKMDRGFFLADNDWTCYRRNYFQVSSTFGIHGINIHPFYGDHDLDCLVQTTHHGLQPVSRFLLGISARVSTNENQQIELIQHTPKRDKGPQMTPEARPIAPGGNLSLSSVGNSQNIATFERIQFKTATANNGKRRAAQQYYVVVIDLYAETYQGERVSVASCVSSPLVVRGRSPGHYADSYERSSSGATGPTMGDLYGHRQPMASPTSAMIPPYYGPPSYAYYNTYPSGPLPPGIMVPTSSVSSSSSSHHTTGPPPPYLVHSMSDPSSSESSSPDLYQAPDYQATDKHQFHMHSLPMDPTSGAEWSRSRYHSAGSVPSPEHHASYFSQPYPHPSTGGAPPTPTTPFSTRKYDTIPPTDHHHHHQQASS